MDCPLIITSVGLIQEDRIFTCTFLHTFHVLFQETAKQTGLSAESLNLVAGDITKHDVQQVLIDTTVNKFGKLDILVNNAGAGFTEEGKIGSEISIECYHKNIELNLTR